MDDNIMHPEHAAFHLQWEDTLNQIHDEVIEPVRFYSAMMYLQALPQFKRVVTVELVF